MSHLLRGFERHCFLDVSGRYNIAQWSFDIRVTPKVFPNRRQVTTKNEYNHDAGSLHGPGAFINCAVRAQDLGPIYTVAAWVSMSRIVNSGRSSIKLFLYLFLNELEYNRNACQRERPYRWSRYTIRRFRSFIYRVGFICRWFPVESIESKCGSDRRSCSSAGVIEWGQGNVPGGAEIYRFSAPSSVPRQLFYLKLRIFRPSVSRCVLRFGGRVQVREDCVLLFYRVICRIVWLQYARVSNFCLQSPDGRNQSIVKLGMLPILNTS